MIRLADAVRIVRNGQAKQFAQHVVPAVVRPARVIWNQALGLVFLLFALLFFGNAARYYSRLNTEAQSPIGFVFSIFLALVMAFFGVHSFLKARRISRT